VARCRPCSRRHHHRRGNRDIRGWPPPGRDLPVQVQRAPVPHGRPVRRGVAGPWAFQPRLPRFVIRLVRPLLRG
jgi:hypothetical protein